MADSLDLLSVPPSIVQRTLHAFLGLRGIAEGPGACGVVSSIDRRIV